MKFKPYFFALNAHFQGIMLCLVELIWKCSYVIRYREEIFECADGGTLLLEWLIYDDKKSVETSNRDIMVFVPGVGGDKDLIYVKTMAKAALDHNYDMVIVNYQGLGAIPLTVSLNHFEYS